MRNPEELSRIREELRSALPVPGKLRGSVRHCGTRLAIEQLELYLRRNLHLRLPLGDVAFILGVDAAYCSKLFRKSAGKTFTQWDRDIRIPPAKRMLRRTDARISMIAEAVGYKNLEALERNFHRAEGVSPREYRKLHE